MKPNREDLVRRINHLAKNRKTGITKGLLEEYDFQSYAGGDFMHLICQEGVLFYKLARDLSLYERYNLPPTSVKKNG